MVSSLLAGFSARGVSGARNTIAGSCRVSLVPLKLKPFCEERHYRRFPGFPVSLQWPVSLCLDIVAGRSRSAIGVRLPRDAVGIRSTSQEYR